MPNRTHKPDTCPHCEADIMSSYWTTPRDDLAVDVHGVRTGIHNEYSCQSDSCIAAAQAALVKS